MTDARRTIPPVVGVCPVLETPFHDDGTVDEEGFRNVVRHAVRAGASSVMFPGFASEYHKLSDAERDRLVEVLFAELASAPEVGAVIAVQDHATLLACRRGKAAAEAGARAVNILPPHFLGPSQAAVLDHVGAVLDAVAPTPGIVQYAPGETGTALDAPALRQLARDHANLGAVKVEARPSGPFIARLAEGSPAIASIEGYAGVLLPQALARGAVAVQPGCSFVEVYVAIWSRHRAGDVSGVAALHGRLLPYLSYWMTHVELIVAAEKLISKERGLIGSAYCRRPGRLLDATEIGMVHRFLDDFADLLPPVPPSADLAASA